MSACLETGDRPLLWSQVRLGETHGGEFGLSFKLGMALAGAQGPTGHADESVFTSWPALGEYTVMFLAQESLFKNLGQLLLHYGTVRGLPSGVV